LQIVVDTSVLYAATIARGSVRSAFLRPGIEWLAPPTTAAELRGHVGKIAKELHRSRSESLEVVETLLSHLTEVEVRKSDPEFRRAESMLRGRDLSDAPFVAVALKVRALGIWSLDKDFDRLPGVPRFTTAAIRQLLAITHPLPEEE
jgi:predicted nucleic acid-binding protein